MQNDIESPTSDQKSDDMEQTDQDGIDQADIIERLSQDKAGTVLSELKGQIAEGRKVAQSLLNAGVNSDDFQSLTDFVKATNAAEEIAETFWRTTHV